MASTARADSVTGNGSEAETTIPVENPATGTVIGSVPAMREAELDELAARGRAAQPAWAAAGFDERGRILRRAQKWMLDNADSVIERVVSESGKTVEDAQLVDENKFGRYFEVTGVLHGPSGVDLRVKTIWMTERLSGTTKFKTLIPIEVPAK